MTSPKSSSTVEMATKLDPYTNKYYNTLEHYRQISFPQYNISPPLYSRMKLTEEEVFVPNVPILSNIIHSNTPRYDLFFQPVDNRISLSSEYIYVSIFVYISN